MNTHIMNLNTEALVLIKNGIKTIEMRLFDEKRKEILIGDSIIFISTEDVSTHLKVRVKGLYRFDSFDGLYKVFDKIKLGYSENDFAHPTDMEAYYSKDKIKEYGVIGIEVEII